MSEDALELSAWERSREATRQIMREMGCDEKGYPLVTDIPWEDGGLGLKGYKIVKRENL